MRRRVGVVAAAVVAISGAASVGTAASANVQPHAGAAIMVTAKTDDEVKNGNCTLREAITAADTNKAVDKCAKGTGADFLLVPAGTYAVTLRQLNVNSQVTIKGSAGTVIDGGNKNWFLVAGNLTVDRSTIQHMQGAFRVDRGARLTLNDTTLRNNGTATPTTGALAGGIYVGPSAVVGLNNVTMNANVGMWAGGVANIGTVNATNVTITGNTSKNLNSGFANGAGGVYSEGTFTGRNVTITNNTRTKTAGSIGAGGVARAAGTVQLANSALSGNKSVGGTVANDCQGPITTIGYDLIKDITNCTLTGSTTGRVTGKDAKLGALAANGGTTQTQLPQAGSPLIDAGNPAAPGTTNAVCATFDQRGTARPKDGNGDSVARCDIGAVER